MIEVYVMIMRLEACILEQCAPEEEVIYLFGCPNSQLQMGQLIKA